MDSQAIADRIKAEFPTAVTDISTFRDEVSVTVDRKHLREVCQFCRDDDDLKLNFLSNLSGIDYYQMKEPRFAVDYELYSMTHGHRIYLKAFAPEDDPVLPSVVGVWAGANWPEREVYDMFGITFEGHPFMQRLLSPYDWTGHAQRKDYPLGYEEVQFSFNYDRIQEKKPHPKE